MGVGWGVSATRSQVPTSVTYMNICVTIRSATHLNVVIRLKRCFSGLAHPSKLLFRKLWMAFYQNHENPWKSWKSMKTMKNHENPAKSGFSWVFHFLTLSEILPCSATGKPAFWMGSECFSSAERDWDLWSQRSGALRIELQSFATHMRHRRITQLLQYVQKVGKPWKPGFSWIFMVFMDFHAFWQKVLHNCRKSSFDEWARPEKHRLGTSGGQKVVCDVIFLSADMIRAGWVTHFSRVRPRPGLANYFWARYQNTLPAK